LFSFGAGDGEDYVGGPAPESFSYFGGTAPGGVVDLVLGTFNAYDPAQLHAAYIRTKSSST
jgi:hypothetical protein